ncbi:hypothetical protein SPI_06665 [Niveomyces insectorum RCEF 264]|uniref:DUF4484 domain-containing protein n=1 Tax=Niveomyces insectorum RCEF 264 TaxID=1081102 RepID=A0A167RH73_9HYPO|nr:hypothetical protein SPI_06665 [Niveomyces insectorum RCEF 264]
MAIPRREPPAALSVPRRESTANGLSADRPPIAALFLIEFDVKAGYTIVWKRVSPGLDVSGAVEYKSLPSGLHAVSEDLIYFVHEDNNKSSAAAADHANDDTPEEDTTHSGGYAGLSAFVNLPTDEAGARFARMIAAGVLVPRSYGRLGRAWRHAGALLDIARKLAANRDELSILEEYWDEHNGLPRATSDADELVVDRPLLQINDSPQISPAVPSATFSGRTGYVGGNGGRQSASDGTAPLLLVPPGNRLSPYHPAWSLTSLLDTFGPLIFPIYRAALLRKRILISTHAPVREVNNFVYNISVLANIPISAVDVLAPTAASRQRIRPLFTVGVNDIPFLLADYAAFSKRATTAAGQGSPYNGPGWIACTTDSILAMKGELWDVLVTMPPSARAARASKDKAWPTVEVAKGVPLKATQRDLRRFRALATGLNRLANRTTSPDDNLRRSTGAVTAEPRPSTTSSSSPAAAAATTKQNRTKLFHMDDTQLVDAADAIVEPVTWAALAYNGFMWWASAGEQRRSDETEEDIYDASLLADIVPPKPGSPTLRHQHHQHHQPYYQQQQPTTATSPLHDSLSSLKARRVSASGARIASVGNAEAADDDDIEEEEEEERAQIELAIITYFHRLTTQLLSVFADVIESNDDSDRGGGAYDADDGIGGDDESGEEDRDGRYFDDDDDDDDDDNGYDDYDDDHRGDGGIGVAHGTGARRDNVVVAGGRSAPGRGADDGLVGVRRSGGLASSARYGAQPNTSATALLLRRRGTAASTNRGAANRRRGAGSRTKRARTHSSTHHHDEDNDDDNNNGSNIRVSSDAVTRMGLDVWSQADAHFVQDVAAQYFGRRGVQVEGKGVEVCGLKIC